MAESTPSNLQTSGVPQNNDSTTVQEQQKDSVPSTATSNELQTNAKDVNNIKTNSLAVKTGPKDTTSKLRASGTVLSIVLVAVILVVAGSLFFASLRVKDEPKPTVAVGAEDNGALGKVAKKKKSKNKKQKKGKK